MNIFIVILMLALGVTAHIMVRLYAPWKDKDQNFFWLATFGPLVATQVFPIPPDLSHFVLAPLFGGAIMSEFLRTRTKGPREKLLRLLHGQSTGKPSPRSSKKKSNTNKKPR